MEQDVENSFPLMCTTCLSTDRNLFAINAIPLIYQMFRIMMYDFAGDRFGDSLDMEQLLCWECLAMMKKFLRFKQQVHNAQDHLRVMALSRTQETFDHNYMSQSLSSLERCSKSDYDKIFFDYATAEWPQHYIAIADTDTVKNETYDVAQVVRDSLGIDDNLLEVPEIVLENPMTGVMSHIVVNTNSMVTSDLTVVKGELPHLTISPLSPTAKVSTSVAAVNPKSDTKVTFTTEFMTEEDMLAYREQLKLKPLYESSVYKCELCIIGFYGQQQVEDHFVSAHRSKSGHQPCKICYMYVEDKCIDSHEASHYFRYKCKLCGHDDNTYKTALAHAASHKAQCHSTVIIGDAAKSKKKKIAKDTNKKPPKPGDLRKLLSKTTIEGYQCLECDMFFKTSRARKNHVQRFHREGLQCDHCKKRFVNRTTLATHLRLHEGPLPRSECPICHKMVRVIQLKYHIQRHETKSRHVCVECNKVFSHMATYQAHLKYSRAHAKDNVFKYPCPMCNKGYPTKEQMQDHFNYQHLGKTTHKCPVCNKPIASRANVEKHMMRVHGEKKEKPRNHHCDTCGKAFTDKKALTQHEAVHSRERPLSCDICGQTFKQKASLYTHRKRVHKVFIPKRKVEFMDNAENS